MLRGGAVVRNRWSAGRRAAGARHRAIVLTGAFCPPSPARLTHAGGGGAFGPARAPDGGAAEPCRPSARTTAATAHADHDRGRDRHTP